MIPIYERNRQIQELCIEAEKRHYAVWFRPRSRVFMINGQYFDEKSGLLRLKELLSK
jgi:hypothetical protein